MYCCEQAVDEPMAGTADPVDVWLMLEYRPVWTNRALTDNELAEPVRTWLEAETARLRAQGLKVRPQFIRQPEIDRADTRLVIGHAGGTIVVSSEGYRDLLDQDVAALLETRSQTCEPLYFVCTNGQRDVCCARFGRPVYPRLRERLGDRVWQTTHLGGHRFAANVLVLPQGAVYGRVTPEAVDDFVDTIERGELAFDYLRGRSCYPPAVQAAEALLRRSDLHAPRILAAREQTTVAFSSPTGEVTATVREGAPIEVLASCGDTAPKPIVPWVAGDRRPT
jgi:hypothetical protein